MFGEVNLLASPVITDPSDGRQYYPEPGAEPFDVVLTTGQVKKDLSQYFPKDCQFLITALTGTQTGAYSIQLILPDGKLLSSAALNNANLIGTGQFPVAVFPPVRVPAGGKVGINVITDLSAADNTVQIVFHGVRLYPLR
jgi:hypothetical protein